MVIYKDDILMLRTWRAADAASLAANADDITLWNNVRDLFPHPYTLADAREFIAAAEANQEAQRLFNSEPAISCTAQPCPPKLVDRAVL